MSSKLEAARAERVEMQDHAVDRVESAAGDVESVVIRTDGFMLLVQNELGAPRMPIAGDTLRLFGRGLGYPVRGIGLVENRRLVALYRYETATEAEASHRRIVEDLRARKRGEWEAKKGERAATIAALPEPFRRRIEFFMRRPDWGWEFGPYEVFCCVEAVKIAEALACPAAIIEFSRAKCDEQKGRVPGLAYDKHSGNTFGTACFLARAFLEAPELVPQCHGALCPLAGCEDYGCFAAEAKQ